MEVKNNARFKKCKSVRMKEDNIAKIQDCKNARKQECRSSRVAKIVKLSEMVSLILSFYFQKKKQCK